MFTGIIEALGELLDVRPATTGRDGGAATRLTIRAGSLLDDLQLGASVAVNGVCLTLAERNGPVGGFDVIPETVASSTLGSLRPGHRVHLERSLAAGGRIDGHFVQGHIDGVGTVAAVDRTAGEWLLWIAPPAPTRPYLVPKGSVAVDGVSLTLARVEPERFAVALIPTTLADTLLGDRAVGDGVNIETDILARVVVNTLRQMGLAGPSPGGVTWDSLREAGFIR